MMYLGDFDLSGAVITIPFTTHEADGGSVAPSSAFEADDVRIYKNSSATQRASTSGITMTSPFDSVTGLHILSIDISDDDDVGFFDSGNDYHVVLVPDETVDGQTVVKLLATFSIQNRYNEVVAASVGSGAITSASFTAGAITAGIIATDAIGSDELAASAITEIQSGLATSSALTTVGTNVDTVLTRLGTPSNLGGGATIAANLSDIEGQTDDIGAAGAGLTALATAAALATVSANVDSILADTSTDGVVLANNAITNAKIASGAIGADELAADVITDIWQGTALTEAYATDGAAATPAQLLHMIWAMLAEKSVSGTTLTVKRLDGSTPAMTFTLNDSSNPTSITRAS